MTKKGTQLFLDCDVYVLRQIDSKSKSAAFVELPRILPTTQSFFFPPECIAGERELSQVGYEQVPLFGMFARGYTPPSLRSLGSLSFVRFCPFSAPWGLLWPGMSRKHRRWVTVPARSCCDTTKRLRPTSKPPAAQTRSNVIGIYT